MKPLFKSRFTSLLLSTFLCSLTVATQTNSLKQLRMNESFKNKTELSKVRLSMVKRAPTLGFRNIVADWVFIQFLQYFGNDKARGESGYGDSPEYLSVAIQHDPYFKEFYVFLSGSTTLYAGIPEKTVGVMSQGLRKIASKPAPDSYYIWRYKGTDELLFLGDGDSAKQSFEMAAEWARESSNKSSVPIGRISEQTAQFLSDNPDSKLAQINAWGSVLTTALDDVTQSRAVSKIRELGGDVVLTENGQFKVMYSKAEESDDNQKSDI